MFLPRFIVSIRTIILSLLDDKIAYSLYEIIIFITIQIVKHWHITSAALLLVAWHSLLGALQLHGLHSLLGWLWGLLLLLLGLLWLLFLGGRGRRGCGLGGRVE